MNFFTSSKVIAYRDKLDEVMNDLHRLTEKIKSDTLSKTVNDLRGRLHDPYLFVIVGEVKAGKSSFTNALLNTGKEICKVAPQPMTDTIQQIVWGETEEEVMINPFLKRIYQPVEILKEVAIVDTPGTNTIVAHHQEITEEFIPAADLVVFVFECKNPYRQSAWDFFDFINAEWQKKIVFVLQQKDLMPVADLKVNMQGVRDQAFKKGIQNPVVFAVSAKDEIEERYDQSGFSNVRDYIRSNITGGKAGLQKVLNNVATAQNINERIHQGLKMRKEQYISDTEFRNDIVQTLAHQESNSLKQVRMLVENIVGSYDKITQKSKMELSDGLSFVTLIKRSITGIFGSKTNNNEWLEVIKVDLEKNLHNELKERLYDGVGDVAESIQQMAKIIDLKIQNSKTILKHDHEIFSDIADRRSNVLKELQEAFNEFMNNTDNFTNESIFSKHGSITPNIAAGSGIAIVGIIIAAVTNGAVLDITGGLLTTVGLIFAGATAMFKRGQILKSFDDEIDTGRTKLNIEISNRLEQYIKNIKTKIDGNFTNFDVMLDNENKEIAAIENEFNDIESRLESIRGDIG
jgi:GTPase SAR1 family protein